MRRPAAISARRVAASAAPGLSRTTPWSSRSTMRRAPPPGRATTVVTDVASSAEANGASWHQPWLWTVRVNEKSAGVSRRARMVGPERSVLLRDALVLDLQKHARCDVARRVVAGEARRAHARDPGLALSD